jgi:hypothetical protein
VRKNISVFFFLAGIGVIAYSIFDIFINNRIATGLVVLAMGIACVATNVWALK